MVSTEPLMRFFVATIAVFDSVQANQKLDGRLVVRIGP